MSLERIQEILASAATLAPKNPDERAVQGYIIGAAFALKMALRYAPDDALPRGDSSEETDYADWAQAVINDSEHTVPDRLFGYYMNDALHRCATLYTRVAQATQLKEVGHSELGRQILLEHNTRFATAPKNRFTPRQLQQFLGGMLDLFTAQRK